MRWNDLLENNSLTSEAFDSVATVSDPEIGMNKKTVYFTVNDIKYFLSFYQNFDEPNEYTVDYGFVGKGLYDMHNPGIGAKLSDSLKVLGTVISEITKFIQNVKPQSIDFSGENYGDVSLGKTYQKMIKKFEPKLKSLGYEVKSTVDPDMIYFYIVKV